MEVSFSEKNPGHLGECSNWQDGAKYWTYKFLTIVNHLPDLELDIDQFSFMWHVLSVIAGEYKHDCPCFFLSREGVYSFVDCMIVGKVTLRLNTGGGCLPCQIDRRRFS